MQIICFYKEYLEVQEMSLEPACSSMEVGFDLCCLETWAFPRCLRAEMDKRDDACISTLLHSQSAFLGASCTL